jgi:hypothetical protein
MLRVSNKRSGSSLGQAGASSLEFALVAVPFSFLLIAATDLGRYFITQHSLRTLTSVAARSVMVNCFGLGACPFATAVPSPQQVWAKVPFLNSALSGASLTASQVLDPTGVRVVTVSAQYPFTFILPAWAAILSVETCSNGPPAPACPVDTICETTCLNY